MTVYELLKLLENANMNSQICMVRNYDDIRQGNFDNIEAVVIERCIDDTKLPLEMIYLTASDV